MTSDAEHPFICLCTLCMSSLEKCLFRFFAQKIISFLHQMLISGDLAGELVYRRQSYEETMNSVIRWVLRSLMTQKPYFIMPVLQYVLSWVIICTSSKVKEKQHTWHDSIVEHWHFHIILCLQCLSNGYLDIFTWSDCCVLWHFCLCHWNHRGYLQFFAITWHTNNLQA